LFYITNLVDRPHAKILWVWNVSNAQTHLISCGEKELFVEECVVEIWTLMHTENISGEKKSYYKRLEGW